MRVSDLVQHFGTKRAFAQALGLSESAITQWGELVPELRQYQVEVITDGKFKAARPKPVVTRVELTTTDLGVQVTVFEGDVFDASYAITDLARALYIASSHLKGQQPSKRRLLTGKDLL